MEGNAKSTSQEFQVSRPQRFRVAKAGAASFRFQDKGQTLVELLLALGIFAFVMTAVFALVFGGLTTGLRTEEQDYATMYAQEGLDAARSIRDRDWGSFVSAVNGKTHGVNIDANYWAWDSPINSDLSDEIPFGAREFIREITVEDAFRDADGNISSAGTPDTNTKKVTSSVKWQSGLSSPDLVLIEYLTNWNYNTWTQTSYSDFSDNLGISPAGSLTISDIADPYGATKGKVAVNFNPWFQTSDTDFGAGEPTDTQISGTGPEASIKLDYYYGSGLDNNLDLSLCIIGGACVPAGGCNGSGLSWSGSTCTIATGTKNTFNFQNINIPASTALTASGSNKITIYATGTVTIDGTINLNASGQTAIAGGGNGGNRGISSDCSGRTAGVGVGPGGIGGGGAGGSAGGGGGFGAAGTGSGGGSAYPAINPTTDVFYGGSGGGGGPADCQGDRKYSGYAGGGGGGSLRIASGNSITIGSTGIIQANGANGGGSANRQGGGGAGGGILLQAQNSIANNGSIQVKGGVGPDEGGDGGGGRARLETPAGANITGATVVVSSCVGALASIDVCGGASNYGTGRQGAIASTIYYKSSGTYTSSVFNTGQSSDFTTLEWNSVTPMNIKTVDINYNTSTDYTYDPAKIEFSGTAARLKNQSPSPTEITPDPTDTKALWHLNEGSGITTADTSNSSPTNTGKLGNSVIPYDQFTGANGSAPDTANWSQMVANLATIQNNTLSLSATDASQNSTGVTGSGKITLSGDFDIQVDFSNFAVSGTTGGLVFDVQQTVSPWYVWRIQRLGGSGWSAYPMHSESNYDGTAGTYGNAYVPYTSTSGSFRIARVGTTFTVYYNDNAGSGWVSLRSYATSYAGDVYPRLFVRNDATATSISGNFDNFKASASPTWTTAGKFSNALSFDGVDDYVSVPASASVNGGWNTMTLEGWFKFQNTTALMNLIDRRNVADTVRNYQLQFNRGGVCPSGSIAFFVYNSPSFLVDRCTSSGVITSTSEWYHIAAVYDGTSAGTKIYINGIAVATTDLNAFVGGTIPTVTDNYLALGRWPNGANQYFSGSMDEVAIWDTALPEATIAQHAAVDYSPFSGATVINKIPVPSDPTNILSWQSFSATATNYSDSSVLYQISNDYTNDGNDANDTWCNYDIGSNSWNCAVANSSFSPVADINSGLVNGGFGIGAGMAVRAKLNASSNGFATPQLGNISIGYYNKEIKIEMRAGPGDADCPGACAGWTSWQEVAVGESSAVLLPPVFDNHQYAQYKISLVTVDQLISPELNDITINYFPLPIPYSFTSKIYDTGGPARFSSVGWAADKPAGTNLGIEIRAGNNPDLSDALIWTDAGSTGSFISLSAFDGKQYFQYRAIFTPDTTSSSNNFPSLYDITTTYKGLY